MTSRDFQIQAITLIDDLKSVCANYGLGNDGNEYKIITQIIRVFNHKEIVEDFSVVVSYEDITAKNYSLSAGQYFDVKVDHVEITPKQFEKELAARNERLKSLFGESGHLEKQIEKQLATLTASPEKGRDRSPAGRDRSPQRSGE